MAPASDDLRALALRFAIPRQRTSGEQARILADDRLVEDLRAGCIADDSPVHPAVRMLARWHREIMAVT